MFIKFLKILRNNENNEVKPDENLCMLINRESPYLNEVCQSIADFFTGENNSSIDRESSLSMIIEDNLQENEPEYISTDDSPYEFNRNIFVNASGTTADEIASSFTETISFKNSHSGSNNYSNDIDSLEKELELLKIKNLRRGKLTKELNSIKRNLNRLQNRKSGHMDELNKLNTLNSLDNSCRDILESIEALKNDLDNTVAENRSLQDKENEILNLASHYSELNNKLNLEELQKLFNSIRDNSADLELNRTMRKKIISRFMKSTVTIVFSTGIIFMFILYKTSMNIDRSFNISRYLIMAGAALLTLIILQAIVKLRQFSNDKLLKTRRQENEKILLDYMNDKKIEHEKEKIGELYEYLMQYLEDHVKMEELTDEKNGIEAKIEKGKSVETISEEIETLNSKLKENEREKETITGSVKKFTGNISDMISDLHDEIEDVNSEIENIESIKNRITSELEEYDKLDSEGPFFESRIDRINDQINSLKTKSSENEFLSSVFKDSVSEWQEKILSDSIDPTIALFNELTNNEFSSIIDNSSVKKYYLTSELPAGLPNECSIILSFLLQFVITIHNSFKLPPYLFMLPDTGGYIKNIEAFYRIMLELSDKRQVIIFSDREYSEFKSGELYI